MTDKHQKHECCRDAAQFLRGYPRRGASAAAEPGYNWHLLGADRYCSFCPWCGGELESMRKEALQPRVTVESVEFGDVLTVDATPDQQVKLLDALRASGLRDALCACGRPFLTRSTDPRCPPCRGVAVAEAGE